MERTGVLIKRLLEQYESHADVGSLLVTAQMLMIELQHAKATNTSPNKKVSVTLPKVVQSIADAYSAENAAIKEEEKTTPTETISPVEEFLKIKAGRYFDPLHDIPTLAHQNKNTGEINEIMAAKEESLNERLKIQSTELGNILHDAPVRDLKKAIGINDRFLFINELFRGDENMYERSIKTINTFSILPEAEYWIQRELKLKQGWNEHNETVKHFDQIIKRRFS